LHQGGGGERLSCIGRRSQDQFEERLAAIESWQPGPIVPPDELAAIDRRFDEEQVLAASELQKLAQMPVGEARARLDELESKHSDQWPGALDRALTRAEFDLSPETGDCGTPTVSAELAEGIKLRYRRREEKHAQRLKEIDKQLEDSTHRFLGRFRDKDEAGVRAAVGTWISGARFRAASWQKTVTAVREQVPGFKYADPTPRGNAPELHAVVALVDMLDEQASYDEPRRLGEATERDIRRVLAEYLKAVKASRRRDLLNVCVPISAFVVCVAVVGILGKASDFRKTDVFGTLAQVLPVLLLALAVEVRFLAERGLARMLTAVTVVLVSSGFAACVYVLVADAPGRLAAGLSVGAAAAGLTGLVAAVLWRQPGPQEVFGSNTPT
jgi:hypothetical protein